METGDTITFTEEIINGKVHFLCSVDWKWCTLYYWFLSISCMKFLKKGKIKLLLYIELPNLVRTGNIATYVIISKIRIRAFARQETFKWFLYGQDKKGSLFLVSVFACNSFCYLNI